MKECVDEGMLQSYFDDELAAKMMEQVASHVASCGACAAAVGELESESALLANAFEPELALSVPTEKLRQRIDAAIAAGPDRARVAETALAGRGWFQSLVDLFALSPQRTFGYSALAAVVIFAAIVTTIQFRRVPASNPPAIAGRQNGGKEVKAPLATATPDNKLALAAVAPPAGKTKATTGTINANYYPSKIKPRRVVAAPESDHVKLLPGERGYLKTIAALDTTIKSEPNRPMRPALQSEYERNLAMVDRAIAATRNAAKSNPNDPDAAEFMFAAYQSKVDFLNQVADARLANKQH
jgi:hypothetical protein